MSKLGQSLEVSNLCNLLVIVLLFSYVVNSCSINNSSSAAIQAAEPLSPKLHIIRFQQKRSFFFFFTFFELVIVESCFTNDLPYFSIRQIKEMTPVFFPYPVLCPHTAMMLPLQDRTKMPAFWRLTYSFMFMQMASKFMVLMKVVSTRNGK